MATKLSMSKLGKRLFSLHIQYGDFDWVSPFRQTLESRVVVYDPFQTRKYVPLSQVDAILAPLEGVFSGF